MKLPRRQFLHLATGAAALPALSHIANAQSYPTRPVRVIVPFAPAGPTDVFARLLAQEMSEHFGRQFYVENLPGAGGNVGTGRAARAAPDGYTVLIVSSSYAVSPALFERVPYDPARDFDAVTLGLAHHDFSGHDQNLFGSHGDVFSGANRSQRWLKSGRANDGDQNNVSRGQGRQLEQTLCTRIDYSPFSQLICERFCPGRVADRHGFGPMLLRLGEEKVDIIARGQPDQADMIGQVFSDLNGAGANRSGAAQQHHVLHIGAGLVRMCRR